MIGLTLLLLVVAAVLVALGAGGDRQTTPRICSSCRGKGFKGSRDVELFGVVRTVYPDCARCGGSGYVR